MIPRSKHVFILVLFIVVLLAGLLFAQRAGGRHAVQSGISAQAALVVSGAPIDMRLEKINEDPIKKSRKDFVEQLQK